MVMLEEFPDQHVSDLTFRNNVFVMNDEGYCAMNFHQKRDGETVENFTIVNNTFVHPNGLGSYAIRFINVRNVVVKNNIFYDYGGHWSNYVSLSNVEGVDIGSNCVFKSDGEAPQGDPYPDDLWMVNPEFVDYDGGEYGLQPTSPCINAGTALTMVPNDFDGKQRPIDAEFDIGAFEYGEGPLSISPPQRHFSRMRFLKVDPAASRYLFSLKGTRVTGRSSGYPAGVWIVPVDGGMTK
jgi:hypothetical protein